MWIKYQIWNNLLLVIFYACWGKRRKCMRVNQRCTEHTWYTRASISFFFSYFIHLQFLWHWDGWEEKVGWSKDLARLKANNFCYKFSINQITYLLNLVLIHLNLVVVSSFDKHSTVVFSYFEFSRKRLMIKGDGKIRG